MPGGQARPPRGWVLICAGWQRWDPCQAAAVAPGALPRQAAPAWQPRLQPRRRLHHQLLALAAQGLQPRLQQLLWHRRLLPQRRPSQLPPWHLLQWRRGAGCPAA